MKLDAPGIYSIKNNISNKIYIGSAINLERRFGSTYHFKLGGLL